MITRSIFPFLCLAILLCSCNGRVPTSVENQDVSEDVALSTATLYPTQTAYPTQTPMPTMMPVPVDISSAQPLPSDSLDWGMTFNQDGYHPLVTWWDGSVLRTRIDSSTPGGWSAVHSEIYCSAQLQKENLQIPGEIITIENSNLESLEDQLTKKNSTSVAFLQENCLIEFRVQEPPLGMQAVYQIARKIAEQLPKTIMEKGLAFPSYTVNPQAFSETMMFVDQTINPDSARFEVTLSTKKPFIRVVTLAIYDKTEDKFLSRTDYHNHSFLSPERVTPNEMIFANPSHQYQLWVWVEDDLVSIGDFALQD